MNYLQSRKKRLIVNAIFSCLPLPFIPFFNMPIWLIIVSIVNAIAYCVTLYYWRHPDKTLWLNPVAWMLSTFIPLTINLIPMAEFNDSVITTAVMVAPSLATAVGRIPKEKGKTMLRLMSITIKLIILPLVYIACSFAAFIQFLRDESPAMFIVYPFVTTAHYLLDWHPKISYVTSLGLISYTFYLMYYFDEVGRIISTIITYLIGSVGFEDLIMLVIKRDVVPPHVELVSTVE